MAVRLGMGALILILWIPCALEAQGKGKAKPPPSPSEDIPAEAIVTDAGNAIRSDGNDTYTNGVLCVIARVQTQKGQFFLRTVGGNCFGTTGQHHPMTLDFGDSLEPIPPADCLVDDAFGQTGQLDICDANAIPDVRLVADKLFNESASATPVSLHLSLEPDFQNTGFELVFEQPIPITDRADGFRELTAGPSSVAELYKIPNKGKKISLGRFFMPFALDVQFLSPSP